MSLFSEQPFYNGSILNFLTVFGEFFSGIKIQKNSADLSKVIGVPIEFAPKNKWVERIKEEPNFNNTKVKMTLPRMSYELVDMKFDQTRKFGAKGQYIVGNIGNKKAKIFNPSPYNLTVNLYSMTKTMEEALIIKEQILPYFSPYLTINMESLPQFGIRKDVPITLVQNNTEDFYQGSVTGERNVIQTFTFVAKIDIFGPIYVSSNIIKSVFVDIGINSIDNFELNSNNNYRYNAKVNPITAAENESYNIDETYFGENV